MEISFLFPLPGINQPAHRKMVLMRFSLGFGGKMGMGISGKHSIK